MNSRSVISVVLVSLMMLSLTSAIPAFGPRGFGPMGEAIDISGVSGFDDVREGGRMFLVQDTRADPR